MMSASSRMKFQRYQIELYHEVNSLTFYSWYSFFAWENKKNISPWIFVLIFQGGNALSYLLVSKFVDIFFHFEWNKRSLPKNFVSSSSFYSENKKLSLVISALSREMSMYIELINWKFHFLFTGLATNDVFPSFVQSLQIGSMVLYFFFSSTFISASWPPQWEQTSLRPRSPFV